MSSRHRLFAPLALATALLTIGLIVFGAVVRVTDSGLGCGNSWPLCNGTIFPPLDNLTAWIEWLHRLFAALIGVLGLITLGVAIAAYRKRNRAVLWFTVAAALLFFLQSMLGALVVVMDLPPTFVTLHLGTAMLLLASLLVAAVAALYRPAATHRRDSVTWMVYITTALSFVIILTGALVRGSGAVLACLDWPLCSNEALSGGLAGLVQAILPTQQGQLAMIHMLHRLAVGALGITLLLLIWYVFRQRRQASVRWLAAGAGVLFLAQATIGALYVFSFAAPIWGALHVGFAAGTWAALVALSVIETLNTREQTAKAAWQPQPEPAQA
jgi:heme A synthase